MEKLRLGVLGGARGTQIVRRGFQGELAQIVIVCEPDERLCRQAELQLSPLGVRCTSDFGKLLSAGLDAVIIANEADRHASFAIKALRHGLHVLSYPQPVSTLDEACSLERTVRESGKIYALAESYCYRRGVVHARDMIKQGDIGNIVYAEGSCIGAELRQIRTGDEDWRNYVPSSFMCTHSIGPMLYASGLRAVRVNGAETQRTRQLAKVGAKNGSAAVELLEFDGGAIGRSLHGSLMCPPDAELKLYGESGVIEISGERVTLHDFSGGRKVSTTTIPASHKFIGCRRYSDDFENAEASAIACFVGKILGDADASAYSIDIYRAFDMSLPGLLAYRSILDGGRSFIVPDMRTDEGREFCRGDRFTTDPRADARYRLPTNKNRR